MIGQSTLDTHQQKPRTARKQYWLRCFLITCLCLGTLLGGAAIWIRCDPAVVPEAVDVARGMFGPQAVAQIEAWAFQTQDAVRQARYRTGATQPSVQWATPATTLAPIAKATKSAGTPATANAMVPSTPPRRNLPTLDWSPYVATASGQAVLERTLVSPDPERPYVQAALVRIDLEQSLLHLVAGTQEPISPVKVARPGKIPVIDYSNLLAAFNGGFKAVNGSFGIGLGKTTLLPAHDGLATVAIYRDGSVRLGTWGSDLQAASDMVAFRQNCPLLLDHGHPTAESIIDDPVLWGKTVGNKIATSRSGLGISADGRYLFYVAGDGLTVPTLANALALAGADRGMQLDINSFWTRFVAYSSSKGGGAPVAQKLTSDMLGDSRQFIAADTRDFFYLTLR